MTDVDDAYDAAVAELSIAGKVDGVGFEEFAAHYARRLSLSGQYRSLGGGLLRITLFGRRELIEMFEIACSLGPRGALVDGIKMRVQPARKCRFDGFRIKDAALSR